MLLVQYSALVDIDDKDAFIREHPELKDKRVAVRALLAARLRLATWDSQAAARYANAAFCLAGDLDDTELGVEAAEVLADACELAGAEDKAYEWRMAALELRADLE